MAAVLPPAPGATTASTDPFWRLLQLDYDAVEADINRRTHARTVHKPLDTNSDSDVSCDDAVSFHEDDDVSHVDMTSLKYRTSSPVTVTTASPVAMDASPVVMEKNNNHTMDPLVMSPPTFSDAPPTSSASQPDSTIAAPTPVSLDSQQVAALTDTSKSSAIDVIQLAASINSKTVSELKESASVKKPVVEEDKSAARLRFQWKKTLPTKTSQAFLKVPFKGSPIRLTYNKDKDAFVSEELQVPCGDYRAHLSLDQRDHAVELLYIRFYTFEADVFLTEEEEGLGEARDLSTAIADSTSTASKNSPSSRVGERNRDTPGASHSKKQGTEARSSEVRGCEVRSSTTSYRSPDIVHQILQREGVTSKESSVSRIPTSVTSSRGGGGDPTCIASPSHRDRRLPTDQVSLTSASAAGDCSSRMDDDLETMSVDSGIRRSRLLEKLVQRQLEDRSEGGEDTSNSRVSERVRGDYEDDLHATSTGGRQESRRGEREDTGRAAADYTYKERDWSLRNGRTMSRTASSEKELSRYLDHSGSDRRQPEQNGRPEPRPRSHSPASAGELPRYSAADHVSAGDSNRKYAQYDRHSQSYSRSNDLPDRHGSHPTLNGRHDDSVDDDRYYGDKTPNRHGSLPSLRGEEHRDERRDERKEERRTLEREPSIRASLVTQRTVPLSRLPTPATSTSRTPMAAGAHDADRQNRVHDLEATVLSLKRQLGGHEAELDELRAANRNLENELYQARTSPAPSGSQEADKRINELIREKENMATEIWRLKQEVERSRSAAAALPSATGTRGDEDEAVGTGGIGMYDPNNKRALTRKIEDLESQLRDLQEVNESTVASLQQAEKEAERHRLESEDLRRERSSGVSSRAMRELEDENRALRSQLKRVGAISDDSDYMKQEIEQLRSDLRALRDKNHTLVQDNIKLTEHLRDLDVNQTSRSRSPDKYQSQRSRSPDKHDTHSVNAADRDVFRVRGRGFDAETEVNTKINGYVSSGDERGLPVSRRRHREHSPTGSAVSDSTAVLTSAAPTGMGNDSQLVGDVDPDDDTRYHSDRPQLDIPGNQRRRAGHQRHRTADPAVSDVLDHNTRPPRYYNNRMIDDVIDSHKPAEMATTQTNTKQNGHFPSANHSLTLASHAQPHNLRGSQGSLVVNGHRCHGDKPASETSLVGDEFMSDDEDEGNQRRQAQPPVAPLSRAGVRQETATLRRRDSAGSDSTDMILSEADCMLGHGDQQAAARDQRFTPPGSPRSRSPYLSNSLRSVNAKPTVTQHNKHLIGTPDRDGSASDVFSLATRRPFNPRSPADLAVGDVIKFSRSGGKISRGVVRYIGHLPGKHDTYCGTELEHEMGKHDGVYDGQRYFTSKPNKGVFVAFSKIVMAWGQ